MHTCNQPSMSEKGWYPRCTLLLVASMHYRGAGSLVRRLQAVDMGSAEELLQFLERRMCPAEVSMEAEFCCTRR